MEDTDDLISFLRKREVAETCLQLMQKDKIDCDNLLLMDDEAMKIYLPAFGDRLAAVAFAQKKLGRTQASGNRALERLSKKLTRKKGAKVNSANYSNLSKESEVDEGNRPVVYKRIELGWKHYDVEAKEFKQVRSQKAGGTRQLRVSLKWGQDDILKEGKSLFFHKGKSSKGSASNMIFKVQDFRNINMESKTIGDLYKDTCVKLLRLYICTMSQEEMISDKDDEVQLGKSTKSNTSFQLEDTILVPVQTSTPLKPTKVQHAVSPDTPAVDIGTTQDVALGASNYLSSTKVEVVDINWSSIATEGVINAVDTDVDMVSGTIEIGDDIEIAHTSQVIDITEVDSPEVPAELGTPGLCDGLSPNIPNITHSDPITMLLNRVCIKSQMIAFFKTPEIVTTSVKVNFKNENGVDAQGVSRDAYSSFWKVFFETSADGEDVRVPALNPDYGLEEWQAIGRILVKGFLDVNFFPLQLAPVFFEAIMFGEESLSPNDLFDSFMMFLSESDREVVNSSLHDEVMSEDNRDAFEDLLDREGYHHIPDRDQIKHTIQQLAHKCLIQNSSYALEAMRTVVKNPLISIFPSIDSVRDIYAKLQPSVKKVCGLLESNPQNQQESQSFKYLGQYIRSQKPKGLALLLKFLTGSSVMSVSKITVTFTNSSGFGRMPVIHTCGPVLELPSTYTSYREFRSEWDPLIASGYLNMDIA